VARHEILEQFKFHMLLERYQFLTYYYENGFERGQTMLRQWFASASRLFHTGIQRIRDRRRTAFTLLIAAAIVTSCIAILLIAGAARIWIEPVVVAVLTVTLFGVGWELYWKSSLAERVFDRFKSPQVRANESQLSPLTLFTYQEAKKICQVGPEAIQLSLDCAGSSSVKMTEIGFSADFDFFEFVAEIRHSSEDIVKAAEKVRIAFDKITGKLKPLASGQLVSSIADALKNIPDFFDKLSGLMAQSILPLAHYLSNKDQARTLREINKKLDVLFNFREIDQEAELKSIYIHTAQELSTRTPIYATERFDDDKRGLRRLRYVWAEEILLRLRNAPDFTNAVFRKRKEKSYCHYLLPCAQRLQLFQLAFFTDLCLAYATGSTREFIAVTVKEDIAKLQEISELLTIQQRSLKYMEEKIQPLYPHALAIREASLAILSFLVSIQHPQSGGAARTLKGS